MPDRLPGPGTSGRRAPTLVADPGVNLGVLMKTKTTLDVTPKATIFDDFNNLDDFVTVYGSPGLSFGNLSGEGIVRHKTEALTDSHKASAVVGEAAFGRTRLYICADEGLKSYYAVEIEHNIFLDNVHFVKGIPGASVESAPGLLGFLNSILALLFGLLSIFSANVTPYATATNTFVANNDEIGIWYDEPNSTVRIYKNDVAILNIPVPRGEIPHGPGYRHHGAAVGIEFYLGPLQLGAQFANYTVQDV